MSPTGYKHDNLLLQGGRIPHNFNKQWWKSIICFDVVSFSRFLWDSLHGNLSKMPNLLILCKILLIHRNNGLDLRKTTDKHFNIFWVYPSVVSTLTWICMRPHDSVGQFSSTHQITLLWSRSVVSFRGTDQFGVYPNPYSQQSLRGETQRQRAALLLVDLYLYDSYFITRNVSKKYSEIDFRNMNICM
jgi:hypothetical protein